MKSHRIDAKWWRHDAYTLRCLQKAMEASIEKMLEMNILHPSRSTVIDYGSGEAPYKNLFLKNCSKYIACDMNASEVVDVIFDKDGKLPLDSDQADCILSSQVLEHVWDLDTYLSECRRCLSTDGCLLLSTHGTWLYHPHPTDYRRWTRDGLLRELEERGFEVINVCPVVGPLAWTTQFRVFAYHHVLSHFSWPGRLSGALLNSIMHLRMKCEDLVTPKNIHDSNAAIYVVIARVKKL